MVIQEHRQQSGESELEDLADVLLRMQNDPNQEIRLTDDNIKGVLTDMFIAGTDTSSTTLVWIMAELAKNPSTMRKAQEEVRRVVKETGRRGCPGIDFAVVIIELALANLLHGFDWNLPDGERAEDVDMEESFGIAVHKKTPLYLVASVPAVAI
ncbi:hypothetical protein POM88_044517 [Heracleum sosnowskyi]|uniref:Cytochrome P450 n=1 Tax=Heracleum sosnowskyi TaxID=360622 RepID=A0AAD8H5D1_9APIA|nr:hypothetical protein POM88_044517 [Heracleum sosnowskyi]